MGNKTNDMSLWEAIGICLLLLSIPIGAMVFGIYSQYQETSHYYGREVYCDDGVFSMTGKVTDYDTRDGEEYLAVETEERYFAFRKQECTPTSVRSEEVIDLSIGYKEKYLSSKQ